MIRANRFARIALRIARATKVLILEEREREFCYRFLRRTDGAYVLACLWGNTVSKKHPSRDVIFSGQHLANKKAHIYHIT